MTWSVVEERLGALLAEFGSSSTSGATSAAYPFTRLRSDGIWHLSRDVPNDNLGPLNASVIEGHFTPEIEAELRNSPDTLYAVARALVESQFPLTLAPVGIEAAHVRWFNFDGPDDPDNGLALCSLHHKLFDRGVIGLLGPGTIVVSSAFSAVSPVGRSVYDLHGHDLRPRPGTSLPSSAHIDWHRQEVFKGIPLAA